MEQFFANSADFFYTNILAILCAFACTIMGFIKRNKFKELKLMFIYPLSSLIQTIISYTFTYFYPNINIQKIDQYINLSINLFLLIEFISIFIFFYQVVLIGKLKKTLKLILSTYILIFFYLWYYYNPLLYYPFDLVFIQALYVLLIAVICLIDLFKNNPKRSLLSEPSLWIITGSLLYFLCTLPIYIAREFVFEANGALIEEGLYSINYICYSIFFLLIIRAYLCRPIAQQLYF